MKKISKTIYFKELTKSTGICKKVFIRVVYSYIIIRMKRGNAPIFVIKFEAFVFSISLSSLVMI